MNCKKGELVRYVGRIPRPNASGWIGRAVRQGPDFEGAATWFVDPPLPGGWVDCCRPDWVKDSALRPIRDPGDDATDEMVLIAGKPQEVTA